MNMRKNKSCILLMGLMTLITWCFISCDEVIEDETKLGFPTEVLEIDAVPGDTVEVPFSVGYNWNISSNRDWCLIDGFKSFSGKEGEHTVNFFISDLGNLFVAEEALITLSMNGEERVIARITRRATKKYEMEVSEDVSDGVRVYADGESIVIGRTGTKVLNLEPNFDIDALQYAHPQWIEVEKDDNTFTLNVIADSLRYFINREEDSLRFYNQDKTFYRSFHVQNMGQEIVVETAWGVKVAADGKTYYDGVKGVTYDAPWHTETKTIDALRGYELVCVSYESEKAPSLMKAEDNWLIVKDDKQGNVEVSFVQNLGNIRTAYLFALPTALVEGNEDLLSTLFGLSEEGSWGVRDEAECFVVAEFIQDADASTIKVIDAYQGWKYLDVVNVEEAIKKNEENEEYKKWDSIAVAKGVSPNKVFMTKLKDGASFLLNPLLTEDVWNPSIEGSNHRIEVYSETGKKYVEGKDKDYTAEPTKMEEEEGDYMLVQYTTNYDKLPLDEYYIIYFVTADDIYLKALVVWNYWEE